MLADGFQRGFKCGISGQDECDRIGLCPPHGAHNGESVAWASDVQIRNKDIKGLASDNTQRFRNSGSRNHLESYTLENCRQGQTYRRLVIYKQNFDRIRH
ncbi:MAG TPA: hypothetical protein VFR24_19645 [Candidatus Angelobacter sp.]|nr:hypothetical protein [Candidatus Angelobacter sp.]